MKRAVFIAIGWAMLAGLVFLASCADPLEATGPNQSPEKIYIVDTLNFFDTVYRVDSVGTFDTVFIHDTMWRVDTVMIVDTVNTGGKKTDTLYVVDTVQIVDTILQIDTLLQVDTVILVDTVVIYDTVYVTDTVTQIDTVIIVVPDTGAFRPFCGTLASNQQEIVWMFRNQEGNFRLEFSSTLERVQPGQSVTVDIDGEKYFWDIVADPDFITELHLQQYSTIRITANKPPARGHSIYICLEVTAL